MTGRYTDPFLNALMFSHEMTVRGELWWNNALVGPISLVSGSVSGDRSGSVRRTATITVDPSALKSTVLAPKLNPYGSRIKLWRGIRYPGGSVDEEQVFYGRIDVVESSLAGVSLRCSDLAADIVDARFLDVARPGSLVPPQTTVFGCIKGLISEVHPTMTFDTAGITSTAQAAPVRPGTQWVQERGDALDSLSTQLQSGSEWYIDMNGVAHIHPLPAVLTSGAQPDWIIDTGDVGVLVERVATLDRSGVYNGVKVDGEPVGGPTPASDFWLNTVANGADPNDPMLWGGAFGKVVNYYTGQQLDPNITAAAKELAKQLCLNSLSGVRSLAVTCIPNPKLQLGRPVRVFAGAADVDGMYYVQNLTLPLDPETPMTLTLYTAYQTGAGGTYSLAEPTIPEGATWEPTR